MKFKNNLFGIAAMALCLGLASCSDDDELFYSDTQVTNSELRAILEKQGIQFDETGHMLMDDKVQNLTFLDLTGTKFTDFQALTILPNLSELDLSNNEFGPTFDFSVLPTKITGVDLTGNEIYDFENLVKVEVAENGDETISNLHKVSKLHLPHTLYDNIDDLVRFYVTNKEAITNGTIEMKIEDKNGSLQPYTTLREVPDEKLRNYLKNTFSDLFNENSIDLSKHLGLDQQAAVILIQEKEGVSNFDGIQYIIHNPYWQGSAVALYSNAEKGAYMPAVKLNKHVTTLVLSKLNMEYIDLSNAEGLYNVHVGAVSGIKSLDLTNTIWGQREENVEADEAKGSYLIAYDCANLKEIILPNKEELKTCYLDLECLDALEKIDMSNVKMVMNLTFGNLPESFKISYPELTIFNSSRRFGTYFSCSESTFNKQETLDFLDKNYTKKPNGVEKLGFSTFVSSKNNEGFDWRRALRKKK